MLYSKNADDLIATIVYLGTNAHYWGRSPSGLAEELGLDGAKLLAVFEAFKGIYRRTKRKTERGEYSYSLQARHAQRKGGKTEDPGPNEDIAPLDHDKLDLLIKFVLQMTEQEKANRRAWWTSGVVIGAAIISAAAVIAAAYFNVSSSAC